MDQVVEEVEKVKKDFQETSSQTLKYIDSIQEYGKKTRITEGIEIEEEENKDSLPRLNGLAQDGLNMLQSLQFKLDLLSPQLPSIDYVEKAQALAQSWKNQIQRWCLQRELLLGGGEESTIRRRNLQTKAGMTSAADSITESLRRSRQLMVQEVERSASTLMTFEESTGVLRKAESEYKGHRSLLMRTRDLLSTMQRQDVLDRLIIIVGFLIFSLAVLYVVSKRIGILKLQNKIMDAVKAGMAGQEGIVVPIAGRDGICVAPVHENVVPRMDVTLEQPMHDEL
ncbi:unnamed protein product [Fraxinus pennsylvanica]|uniref:Sec20 C-terminal domain-containing protein n=1 Tax=Fraxinus pennsylvanica TaxID=56036 RepID=A0AAD1ZZ49_9LAMI|nr:unnamed protein product [Fraxinus pennsylvanica]